MSFFEILMQKDAGRGPSTYEYFDGPVVKRFCGSVIKVRAFSSCPASAGSSGANSVAEEKARPPPWIGRVRPGGWGGGVSLITVERSRTGTRCN